MIKVKHLLKSKLVQKILCYLSVLIDVPVLIIEILSIIIKKGVKEKTTMKRGGYNVMKIGIGNDHAAVDMKNQVVEYLEGKGYEVVNFGTDTYESCNYPEYGEKVGRAVAAGDVDLGILICGTGVGISLAANKVKGVRAVVCSEPYSAKLSRQHNNTNILAFGARVIGIELAKMIIDEWLSAEFEGGRHQTRVDMITAIENK